MADLTVQESYHDLTAPEVGVQGGVHTIGTLNEAAHSIVQASIRISLSWHITSLQEDLTYLTLPTLRSEAQAGERINLDADLPGIRLTSMRVGLRMTTEDPWLPTVSSTATMQSGQVGSLSKRLPAMTLSARTAIQGGALNLPTVSATASIGGTGLLTGRLDKTLPGLTIEADGSTPVLASLDKDLPPLSISAQSSMLTTASLDKTLPGIRLAATALVGATATLTANLPVLEMDSDSGINGDSLSLDANLPALVAALGTGEMPGLPGTASNSDRWADYVMRHVR